MHVALLTAGSHGDVCPFVALARGLQRAGHAVTVAAPTDAEQFVAEQGVPYASLGVDFRAMAGTDTGRSAAAGNPKALLKAYRDAQWMMVTLIEKAGEAALEADAVVYHPKTLIGNSIAEARGIPVFPAMATSLRAGRPTVICPFFGDQPFWGQRVHELGIGPEPLPQKKLTAEKLAAAIEQAATDKHMHRRAAEIGVALQSEDGVAAAVRVIEEA